MARRPRGVVVVNELFLKNETTLTTMHGGRRSRGIRRRRRRSWAQQAFGTSAFASLSLVCAAPVARFDCLQQATMLSCIGRLDALELPPHPKLAADERHAGYLMYHDFGAEEGVSGQQLAQVGTKTRRRRGWWDDIIDTDIAGIPHELFVEVEVVIRFRGF